MAEDDKARLLGKLYKKIKSDPLYRTKSMGDIFVPGIGSLQDDLLVFIGEAPGREEEKAGLPFVGPAGRNLNSLLQEIGISRESVFITNLVKYRPMTPTGDNRSPSAVESRCALPYLLKELEIVAPRLVVCLGLASAKAILENPGVKMGEANGVEFNNKGLRILVTYHPSPYNYKAPVKRESMRDAFEILRGIWFMK
ncbi:MAG: uracil-DNA glycosylase [Syntrophobacteraceae bacterium]